MSRIRRHWEAGDFVVTDTSPAYDGSATVNRSGYCRRCLGDMQSFGKAGELGPVLHYHSHKRAKSRGLWGAGKGAS